MQEDDLDDPVGLACVVVNAIDGDDATFWCQVQ